MIGPLQIILIIACLINVILSLFIIRKHSSNLVHISFGLVVLLVALWIFIIFLYSLANSPTYLLLLVNTSNALTGFVPSAFLLFVILFTNHKFTKRYSFLFLLPTFFLVVSYMNLVVTDVKIEDGEKVINSTFLFTLYVYYFLTYFTFSFFLLIRNARRSQGIKKQQIKYLLLGAMLSVVISGLTNLILPVIGISAFTKLGPISTFAFIGFTSYAITRYRLMDIRLVVTRSILYVLLVSIVAGLFTVATVLSGRYLQEEFGIGPIFTTVIASIIIVIGLDPLKNIIARATDKVFYKDKIDYTEVLANVSQTINREIDLDVLIAALTRLVKEELKIERVVLFLPAIRGGGFNGIDDHKSTHRAVRIHRRDPLLTYCARQKGPIVTEELSRQIYDMEESRAKAELQSIAAGLERLNAQLFVPIFVERKLAAILMLGNKLSGDVYSKDDLEFFDVIAPEIGTAMNKAQLYKEVKDFNVKLRIEVKNATEELQLINLELHERNNFLTALQKMTNIITRSLDLQKVTQTIVDGVSQELHYTGAALFLVDRTEDRVRLNAITQTGRIKDVMRRYPIPADLFAQSFSFSSTDNFLTRTVQSGHIQVSERLSDFVGKLLETSVVDRIQTELGIRSAVSVPIVSETEIIGSLLYVFNRDRTFLKETDIQMMRSLADQSGIVVRNLRLYQELQEVNDKLKKANDELKQLDQVKSEFMSIASHQLRTPLSGIMGYLSMLVEGDYGGFSKDQMTVLQNVLDASRRMIRLVNVFLNITRIEAGRFKLNRTKVEFPALITSVANELAVPAKTKGIKLTFEKPTEHIPTLWVDQDKFTDVILNLVDNAIKYTEEGSIAVRIRTHKESLRVEVQDTGVGIIKEQAKNLFNKFVRGSGIARIQPDGSGLGLFIAKKIVEAHAGQIWVESEGEGKGSTFILEIPLALNHKGASEDPYVPNVPKALVKKEEKHKEGAIVATKKEE